MKNKGAKTKKIGKGTKLHSFFTLWTNAVSNIAKNI